jgi:hypothetical protein
MIKQGNDSLQQSDRWQKYTYAIVTVIIVITIFSTLFTVEYWKSQNSSPQGIILFGISPYSCTISPQGIINSSQGAILQVNLTFTSTVDTQQKTIPMKGLSLTYYNSTIDYPESLLASDWGTNNTLNFPQDRFFSYSFSLSKLTLKPLMSASTILRIEVSDDAPTGQYAFRINFVGNSQSNYFPLFMVVTPKLSQP